MWTSWWKNGFIVFLALIIFSLGSADATPDSNGVKPNLISLPKGPGAIEGLGKSFQPALNTGTFSYTVPLALPPAPGGFAPTVEITYNSGAGNSPLGPGWRLAPMLVIERQTEKGFPHYQNGDTFVFNGEELVPLSDGSYRTKNEGAFRRFTPMASPEGGVIDRWLIEDPNGVQHWLGSTDNSRLTLNNAQLPPISAAEPRRGTFDRIYAWYEDAAEDPNGNRITFDYQTFPDDLPDLPDVRYLATLRYHARGQTDTAQVLRFYYEARPDALIDNRAGFAQQLGQRCREVAVYSQRADRIERLRSYVLSYQPIDNALGNVEADTPPEQRDIDLGITRLYAITQYDHHRNPDNPLAEPGAPCPLYGLLTLDSLSKAPPSVYLKPWNRWTSVADPTNPTPCAPDPELIPSSRLGQITRVP